MKGVNRFFQMMGRLVVFARTYPKFFEEDTPVARAMAELEAANQRYVSLTVSLRGSEVAVRKALEDKVNARDELRNFMDTASRIANGLSLAQFVLPKDGGEAALLSVGKMWTESEVLQQKFAEAGLTGYVENLNALLTKTHQASDALTVSRGARLEAAHAIKQTRRGVRLALLRLDAMMRHLLRGDPPVLAVWERSRRIDRPATPKSTEAAAHEAGHPNAPPDQTAPAIS